MRPPGTAVFFLGASSRTSIGDGFDAGFTVRLGMNRYRRDEETLALNTIKAAETIASRRSTQSVKMAVSRESGLGKFTWLTTTRGKKDRW
jgi:hypothetical protein